MAAKIIPEEGAHAKRHVVLLAEDELLIRFDMAEELRQLGCQVIEAGNADQAIDVLRSTARIDVVVTDVQMPGDRNGLDVARAAREERPGVKVIVMSSHFTPTEKHEHFIDLFVSKPTRSHQLAQTIVEFINVDAAKRGR